MRDDFSEVRGESAGLFVELGARAHAALIFQLVERRHGKGAIEQTRQCFDDTDLANTFVEIGRRGR